MAHSPNGLRAPWCSGSTKPCPMCYVSIFTLRWGHSLPWCLRPIGRMRQRKERDIAEICKQCSKGERWNSKILCCNAKEAGSRALGRAYDNAENVMAKARWCLAVIMSGSALFVLLALGIAACNGTPTTTASPMPTVLPTKITPTPTPTSTSTPTPPPKTLVTFLIDCSASVENNDQAKNILWRDLPDFWFSLAKAVSTRLSPDLYFSVILFPSPEIVLTPTRVSDLAQLPAIQKRNSSPDNEYDGALELAGTVQKEFAKRVVVLLSDCTWARRGGDREGTIEDKIDRIGDLLGQLRMRGKVYVIAPKGSGERQWWEDRVDRTWSVENVVQWLPDLTEELLAPFPQDREPTATGERVIGWLNGTTTLDTVLPGDFVSVTARLIVLGPITGPVSFRTTPYGLDYTLDPDRQWPWDNSYSRVGDDLHGGACYPYEGFTIRVNRCEGCPDYYTLGFYQLEFARPEFSLLPNPHESINDKETTITLTLGGLHGQRWQECYTAGLSVSEGVVRGDGRFSGEPLTTVLAWQPEQRPELGPRTRTGTIQLWARGASEAVFTLSTTLTVKYRPELLTVTPMSRVHEQKSGTLTDLNWSDTYSITAGFAPAFAKPEVYLITEKNKSEIQKVNVDQELQQKRGRWETVDLRCPTPEPIQLGSKERYVYPLEEGERALSNDPVAVWWRDGDHYVVKLFAFVPHREHCGYDKIVFRWAPSAEIAETTFQCPLPSAGERKGKTCERIE